MWVLCAGLGKLQAEVGQAGRGTQALRAHRARPLADAAPVFAVCYVWVFKVSFLLFNEKCICSQTLEFLILKARVPSACLSASDVTEQWPCRPRPALDSLCVLLMPPALDRKVAAVSLETQVADPTEVCAAGTVVQRCHVP